MSEQFNLNEPIDSFVGAHWDFGMRRTGVQRPASEHHKFYDKWPKDSIKMQPEWQIAIADSGIK